MKKQSKQSLFDRPGVRTTYFVVLVLLIPGTIIFNSLFIVNSFQKNLTTELQRKALLTTNVIDAAAMIDGLDPRVFQELVRDVADSGEEFLAIDVFAPTPQGFFTIASLNGNFIGEVIHAPHLGLVLEQNQPIAFQTTDPSNQTIQNQISQTGGQYWVVSKTLHNSSDEVVAVMSVKYSSEFIDTLVARTLNTTYLLLTLSVVLVGAILAALFLVLRSESIWKRRVGRLSEARSKFITVTTHVLRTPLNSALWNLEALLGGTYGKLKPEQEPLIRDLYTNNKRMTRSMNDLIVALDASQATLKPELKKIHIDKIIESVVLDFKEASIAKEVTLETKIPNVVPEFQADANLLHQAISKLVDNAIIYSKANSVVKIELAPSRRSVSVVVSDQGVGIPEDEQDSIFEPFERGRKAIKIETDSPGLGLFIAREIANIHGGDITFHSKEGVGSTFGLKLPLSQDPEEQEDR